MKALSELVAAMGVGSPNELTPYHVSKRIEPNKVMTYEDAYRFLEPGVLLEGDTDHPVFDKNWAIASADTFRASA